jgi:hypothetical protein
MQAAVLPAILSIIFLMIVIVLVPWMMQILWHYVSVIMCQREIEIANGQTLCTTKLDGKKIFLCNLKFEDIENISCQKVSVLSSKGGIQLKISNRKHYKINFESKYFTFYPLYTFGKYLDYAEQRWLTSEILSHLQYPAPKLDRAGR